MKRFLNDFKAFALKGNVMDLAVAVVVGAAFGKIVSSLVDNIIMPIVGVFLGGISLGHLTLTIGDAVVSYGVFIQSIIDFLIIALAIFVVIRGLNHLKKKEDEKPEEEKTVETPEEIKLLREIRDSLKREG